jgi:flagellar basal body-associated protein FliL
LARKISKKAKKVLAVILAFLIGLMAIIGGFNIYFSVIGKQKQYGTASGEFWSPNQTFQLEDIPAIELGNKDFKILVITDIHLKWLIISKKP